MIEIKPPGVHAGAEATGFTVGRLRVWPNGCLLARYGFGGRTLPAGFRLVRRRTYAMQKYLARANIERFQKLIADEPAGANRDLLERLLAEERAKLRTYETHPGSTPSQDRAAPASNPAR